ncbi:translesion error-prone DNA polymerase V autoproteolytic subunit [Synechococcales cyanobacterium C]|uniref:Translesion error-prone DNA polymerase V autoproteolytic subunit n=1 Tax=Petrachloros mirabilis ULC683 TaxID=2781853 RepID=A0A8K2A0Z9_9CYAN|nr:translesion error-prone DNA polymerase V autoproteolytic subunit [Petrachloros mirabilis]NCJ07387.1 translesion error-prone DNA polymerase V autoproteolytic subunit [Petrachloros mirabilis ULC683]
MLNAVWVSWVGVSPSVALGQPLLRSGVAAGFPSPAEGYQWGSLDLNQHLIQHPAASFWVRVQGDSMVGAGIHDGDLLLVDRALPAEHGSVIIAVVDGGLTVKRLWKRLGKMQLVSEPTTHSPWEVSSDATFEVWGVVTHAIHAVR